MQKVDYIIVGQGLSGTSLAQRFYEAGKTFVIYDQLESGQASRVASGIWNPIVLKRMKKVWMAENFIPEIFPFYDKAEEILGDSFVQNQKVARKLASVEEANNWANYCDKPIIGQWLQPFVSHTNIKGIDTAHGFGIVEQSGRIDTIKWLNSARQWLIHHQLLIDEKFDYSSLKGGDKIQYKSFEAEGIIFCEGMHTAIENPFFKHLPFSLTKGEVITIECKNLDLNFILNAGVFILPLGDNKYKIGATYAWNTTDKSPTENGKSELLEKLDKIVSAPYKVVNHEAGIRPTVRDRRPLLGTHHSHKNMHIFNGMGSRGVLMAPYFSKVFVEYLLKYQPIPKEANIARFYD